MRVARLLTPLALALCAPQAAQAATLDPLRACYRSVDEVERETVHVQAGGFTPGAAVDVSVDGVVVQRDVIALPDGTVSGDVSAPYLRAGARPFALTVTERDRPANSATARSRVAALALRLKPRESKPSRQVRFLGRGFIDGPEVYGHYVRRGKLRRTVSLGRPKGPCGRVRALRRQIPLRQTATGRWTLQVDNQPWYSRPPAGVFVRLPIVVKRVPRR